jgi:hypothetical protein
VLLPAAQYGDWADVRPRIKAIVRRVTRGEDIVHVMSESGMLDTATTDGRLILSGTSRPGTKSFHCHEPWKHLLDALSKIDDSDGIEERIFQSSMSVPWGVLGFMASGCKLWFAGRQSWYEPFLHAALKAWNEIDTVGQRYFVALQPEAMWAIPNSLHYVLGRLGVPVEHLSQPLPPGGPSALLKYARPAS